LGNPFKNANLKKVLSLIESKGEAYWNSTEGSGLAQIYFVESDDASSFEPDKTLVLTCKDDLGFHVVYTMKLESGVSASWAAYKGEKDFSKSASIRFGGSEQRLPACLFVPLPMTRQIVSHFFGDGSRYLDAPWLRPDEIPWNLFEQAV
jgi:hypothetical protein